MSTTIHVRHWHPAGRAGIAAEERAMILRELPRYPQWYRGQWAKLSDAEVLRRMQVAQIVADGSKGAYDGVRALQAELRRRGKTFAPARDSIRIPRCGMCSHGTEALFHATPDTHGLTTDDGDPWSAWVCVRCWSDLLDNQD